MDRSTAKAVYKIRIQGHLDGRWASHFAGMSITHLRQGITELAGPITDQATLHGLLSRIRDLGMVLLFLEREDLHNDTKTGEK